MRIRKLSVNLIIYFLYSNVWNLVESQANEPEKASASESQSTNLRNVDEQEKIGDKSTDSQILNEESVISLQLNKKETTDSFYYIRSGRIGTYSVKKNYLISKVVISRLFQSDLVIWSTNNPQEYAFKVTRDGMRWFSWTVNTSIFLRNEQIKHFTRPGWFRSWREIPNRATLNIRKAKSDFEFVYYRKNNITSFTPDNGFKIGKVISKKWFSREKVIWKAKDNNEYATKVLLFGSKNDETSAFIYLNNNDTVQFQRAEKDNPWVKVNTVPSPKNDFKPVNPSSHDKSGTVNNPVTTINQHQGSDNSVDENDPVNPDSSDS